MTEILIIAIIVMVVILGVLVYNFYVESQYRNKIHKEFSNSNEDVLMTNKVSQVRDVGQSLNPSSYRKNINYNNQSNKKAEDFSKKKNINSTKENNAKKEHINISSFFNKANKTIKDKKIGKAITSEFSNISKIINPNNTDSNYTLDINDLKKIELPWFNKKFDYLAYISLSVPQPLSYYPSINVNKRLFRIVGCTLDDRFKLAEAIPDFKYKGFIIGLQAINRDGLVTKEELQSFVNQVTKFVDNMNAKVEFTHIDQFLEMAKVLDELCERVDQIIALHLYSINKIEGSILQKVLEQYNFKFSNDGSFCYPNIQNKIFKIVPLDDLDLPFTTQSLANSKYSGFSILFDITHVPPGEKNFNKFMELSVRLARELELDLVDDSLKELSTEWLKTIGDYIFARQKEMKLVGLIPGEDLANRIFSSSL